MSTLLIKGGQFLLPHPASSSPLRGTDLSSVSFIQDGYLLAKDGIISALGPLSQSPERADQVIEAHGRLMLPCWNDSHSHIVFAASREEEFVFRIQGMSYEEIAARGGGILNSARKLRALSESELYDQAMKRLHEMISYGTGALEIKSGYGLSEESEMKMLRVIRKLKEASPIQIKASFLGAHAMPPEFKADREAYIRLLTERLIPEAASEGLADYIDVFCDRGFFTIDESDRILEAGARYGLRPKIHVSQLANIGGVQLGIRHNALSVDHLECAGPDEIDALSNASTIATLLPSCAFFLNSSYAPARGLIDAGAALALATDYNPGSTPSGNMPFVISLACIKLHMLPEEAINAATINGAFAMDLQQQVGTLEAGKLANIIITKPIPSLAYLPYAFGSDHIERVILRGS